MKQIFLLINLLLIIAIGDISAQDKLVFNDEKVVECNVLEITPDVIKYTKHSMPDGPVYTVYKQDVNSIVFENGEIELIKPSANVTYQSGKEKRRDKAADWPVYKGSWGIDVLTPFLGEFRTWFEKRNDKNNVGHTISMVGFWNRFPYYYVDYPYQEDCIYCYDSYYGDIGGFALSYAPKFYFIDHPIVRPFAAPEVAMGMSTNYNSNSSGYFHGMARLGVALTPRPKLNITIDVAGGGHVSFDGYDNTGGGLFTVGMSLGVNFGDGQRKNKE
ncbi:MAG: hypothetical protein GY751_23420 [Bacteroidetes bacterium]|nr:hypothetical protein [Bacteroidota bacterium]